MVVADTPCGLDNGGNGAVHGYDVSIDNGEACKGNGIGRDLAQP